ncbi:MAG: metallophosphoesterase [Verrucomicrobia bacterium]|nr:metallophosphoesterase [Verrucomicrobiota bacterium]
MNVDLVPTVHPAGSTRRTFLRRLAISSAALAGMSRSLGEGQVERKVRFGLIADVHQDVMPDGLERVKAFVKAMRIAQPDFVLQLGDFCVPAPRNQAFLEAWNEFPGRRFHVLGNHDMDGGYTREQTVAFNGMPGRYYAFDVGPVRNLVLDGNEPGGKAAGYRRFIGPDQLAWLERELAQTDRPCVLFVHQPFDADHSGCLENSAEVRAVVDRAETRNPGNVVAVFSGHLHLDYVRAVDRIPHFQINSASYWWLGSAAAHRETFPPEVHRAYPYLTHVAAYREPLWALVTLDLDQGELSVEGRSTEWVGPDPWERGEQSTWTKEQLRPAIADRRIERKV